ncbi:MAG: hypothetical protein AAF250_01830 [Pseudomonadota bacterium]
MNASSDVADHGATEIASILAVLEQQLTALDRLKAHIAAAHLDASIQQLRIFQLDG